MDTLDAIVSGTDILVDKLAVFYIPRGTFNDPTIILGENVNVKVFNIVDVEDWGIVIPYINGMTAKEAVIKWAKEQG